MVKRVLKNKRFTSGNHVEQTDITFKGRSFRSQYGTMKGLTTGYLKHRYYTKFKLENCVLEDTIDAVCTYQSDNNIKAKSVSTVRQRMARGRKVDKQIGDAVQWMSDHALHMTTFLSLSAVPSKISRQYKAWMKSAMPKNIFHLLHKMKLTPYAAQVIVGDVTNRRSSAADLICRDQEGNNVLIELKAINSRTMLKYNGFMTGLPISNCILNQGLLQLGATRSLYRTTYPKEALSPNAYVLVVNDNSCTAYKIPACLVR